MAFKVYYLGNISPLLEMILVTWLLMLLPLVTLILALLKHLFA